MKPLRPTDQKRLNRAWRRRTDHRVALVLDDVQTPYNVGAIIRTAAAFRVEHMWLAGASALPSHPRTGKTALGTDRLVPWSQAADAVAAIADAREAGFSVVGIELAETAEPILEVPLGDAVCLVLGHEDRGLRPAVLAACDAVAFIPQPGKVGSLNVATAAAIALYEVRRREWSDAQGVDLDP